MRRKAKHSISIRTVGYPTVRLELIEHDWVKGRWNIRRDGVNSKTMPECTTTEFVAEINALLQRR